MVGFIDRKEELALLNERFKRLNKGELIILYGRRRVGKTELARKFLIEAAKEKGAYLLIDEGTPSDMLRSISEDIASSWPEVRREFHSWETFFSFLAERAGEGRAVIAIDEFQRMHTDPRAFTRLQKHWDTQLKDKPIMLLLLGSAVGAIHKIAINSKSPLFGRATARFNIDPFEYQAFRQALREGRNEELLVKLYATFGGMPHYLQFAEKCKSAEDYADLIEETMLRKNSILRDEPQSLLRMELKDTGRYNSILAAISAGHRNQKELCDQTGIAPGPIVFYMNKLEKTLKIIKKVSPLCGKHRPQYLFSDNFFAFWYHFVFRNQSTLEIEQYSKVKEKIISGMPAIEGRVFESIVMELLKSYNGKNISGVPIKFSQLGSWWGRKEGDIDILGVDKDSLLAVEVKWTNEMADVQVLTELEQRIGFLNCSDAQRSNVKLMVAAKNGFTDAAKSYMNRKNIAGLTLQDITRLYDALPPK